jgi:hypothetical protein
MRIPITLTPQGVIPRDPDLAFRVARETPPVASAPTKGAEEMPFMGAHVWSTAQQDIALNGQLIAEFDQELFDTDAIHDNATDPHLFTVPPGGAGKWMGMFMGGATATGADGSMLVYARLNGNYDLTYDEIPVVKDVQKLFKYIFPPTLLAAGDTVQFRIDGIGPASFGSDYTDPPDNSAFGPPHSDSLEAVVWRVGP